MHGQKLNTYMETGRVIFLQPKVIKPNPAQPRRIFQAEALEELAASIRQHGILQPLSVRRVEGGYADPAGGEVEETQEVFSQILAKLELIQE